MNVRCLSGSKGRPLYKDNLLGQHSRKYIRTSLIRRDRQKCSPHPEFVLTGVICIENPMKGLKIIVFVLTEIRINEILL